MSWELRSQRLVLRRFVHDDAAFIVSLLNQPSFLEHIGDKGVRDMEGARDYLTHGPLKMYAEHGFGLFMVELEQLPIGMCGLLKRDNFDYVDIGFAFDPAYWGRGYALEAARLVMQYGHSQGVEPIVAITSPSNIASQKLLEKLGLTNQGLTRLVGEDEDVLLFR